MGSDRVMLKMINRPGQEEMKQDEKADRHREVGRGKDGKMADGQPTDCRAYVRS